MKPLLFVAWLILVLSATACKKETIVSETGNNYFMVYLDTEHTGASTINNTRFNENPNNVIITDDSILVKQGGLYHFEGNIYVNCSRNAAASPVFYELQVRVKDKTYTLAQGYTNRIGSGNDLGGANYSLDLPLEDNTGIRFTRYSYNAAAGIVITRFSGYLIRRI